MTLLFPCTIVVGVGRFSWFLSLHYHSTAPRYLGVSYFFSATQTLGLGASCNWI